MGQRNENCAKCVLHEQAKQVCVWGKGPERAKVMIVQESPGIAEMKRGTAFQGPAGELLARELSSVGIEPEDVYITSLVKCRPFEGAAPSPKDIKACREYLEYELEQVNPEYVLLLGASAIKFIKKTGVTELRGTVFDFEGRKYMPIFNPSATIRDPGKLPGFHQDLEKFAKLTNGESIEHDIVPWHIIDEDNLPQFLAEFKETSYFSFDTETTGLLVQAPGFKLNSISFTLDTHETWVLAVAKNDDLEWAASVIRRVHKLARDKRGIGHNGKYDNMVLMATFGIKFFLYFDTILASHTIDENTPHDLKFLARVHCNAPDYDDLTLKEKLGLVGDFNRVLKYNAFDSYYTYRLFELYRNKFKRSMRLRRLFYKLVMPVARVMEDADYGGHYIHLEQFEDTRADLTRKVAECQKQLQALSRSRKKINWNSPAQIADLFYNKLGFPITEYTDKGKPSTGETAILDLRGTHPIVDKLIEYRGYQKFLSTYIEGWAELMVGNYLYLSTKLHGTVTGRFSSRLHQVPRDGTIRNLIGAPEHEGWTFVCADFSQIELRLIAHVADDQRMKMVFQTGGDIHAETASYITGIPPEKLTKEQRKQGKPVNFGYAYGMGWPKFKIYSKTNYGVEFTDEEAQANRDRYFTMYAGLIPWHERMRRIVREQGYVEYLSGRLRRLPGVYSGEREMRGEAERQAINSPIQGFGSGDLKAMAMVAISERFLPDVLRIKGEVHDSILMWVRTDMLDDVLPVVKHLMENPPLFDDFKIELTVPLVADLEVGTWGAGVKWIDKKTSAT